METPTPPGSATVAGRKKKAGRAPRPTKVCALVFGPCTTANHHLQRSTQSVLVPLFDEMTHQGPIEYNFQPDAKSVSPVLRLHNYTDHPPQAKFDIDLVEKLVGMVKDKYDEVGHPPHWQPAASDPTLQEGCSSIFVVDYKSFNKMSPSQIQEVHRDRHILVTGVDSGRPIHFDAEGLQMLSDIDSDVYIQRV